MNAKADKKSEGADEKSDAKSPVHRSPNYPAFPLEEAIKKVKILWDKDHKVGAHKDVVLKHLGYTTESGTALRNLATLKRFDLTTEKDGRITVSQRALDILLYPENDERHIQSVRGAALNPNIYNELYGRYRGAFPSDETLTAELVRERDFNPKQVSDFLADFRETLRFAGLDRPEESLPDGNDTVNTQAQPLAGRPNTVNAGQGAVLNKSVAKSYSVPLKKSNEATLLLKNFPLEKADLELLKKWIDLMEENLTESSEQQSQ